MYVIGLDIGGTKCAITLADNTDSGIEFIKKDIFMTAGLTPYDVIDRYSEYIKEWTKEYNVVGIGISCGGPLDSKKGVIMSPPNLPTWDNIKIVDILKSRFDIPVYLQNDANACAVAEWKYGAGKGYNNMVFLTFGTGLGAGLILNGKLYFGANDNAGEIGHVRMEKTGPLGYGKKGSAEGFCSGNGIKNLALLEAEKLIKKGKIKSIEDLMDTTDGVSAKTIAFQAYKGNKFCKDIFAKCGKVFGRVLALIVDVINPEVIICGGVFMRHHDLIMPTAEKVLKKEALSFSRSIVKILPAGLSEKVGDYAAVSLAKGDF